MATAGMGAVAIFTESGTLQKTLIGSELAAPWGVALAPAGFGPFGGDLLVGNFSYVDSEINAFDPVSSAFEGMIPIDVGPGNMPGGLWSLHFGIGATIVALTSSTSATASTARLMGCLAPYPPCRNRQP